MTLYDFLNMAMEDDYTINIYHIDGGAEMFHQESVKDIITKMEEDESIKDLLGAPVESWDINEHQELTINID